MAARNRAIVVMKWKTANGRNDPAFIDDAPSGVSITDIVGQSDANIPPTPNAYICEVDGLTNAQLTALKAINRYFVLMDAQYDDTNPSVIISSTYDDVPTGGQLTTFKNTIQTRFPDVDDDKLTRAGRAILRAGLTRRQILDELIDRWKGFVRG